MCMGGFFIFFCLGVALYRRDPRFFFCSYQSLPLFWYGKDVPTVEVSVFTLGKLLEIRSAVVEGVVIDVVDLYP